MKNTIKPIDFAVDPRGMLWIALLFFLGLLLTNSATGQSHGPGVMDDLLIPTLAIQVE